MVDYSWYKFQRSTLNYLTTEPMYVKLHDKYDDSIHLIDSQESLVEVMIEATKSWYTNHFLPHPDWFFQGSFEEYFEKNMGMRFEFFEEFASKVDSSISFNNDIISRGKGMKRAYAQEQEFIKKAELFKSVANGDRNFVAGELLACLCESTYNDREMFVIERFSNS